MALRQDVDPIVHPMPIESAIAEVLGRALPLERTDSRISVRIEELVRVGDAVGARLRIVTWTAPDVGQPSRIDQVYEGPVALLPSDAPADPYVVMEGYLLAWTILLEVRDGTQGPPTPETMAPADLSAVARSRTPVEAAVAVLNGVSLPDLAPTVAQLALQITNDTWGRPARPIGLGGGSSVQDRLITGLIEASDHFPAGFAVPRPRRSTLHPLAVFLVMATAGIGVADAVSHFTASVTSARLMVAAALLLQYYTARSHADFASAGHRVSLVALGLCALWGSIGLAWFGGNGFPVVSDAFGLVVFWVGFGWLVVRGRFTSPG